MSKRIYTVFLFALPYLLNAQVVSKGGRFAVDFDSGCDPFQVNVTVLDSFGSISRQYIYEDGVPETSSQTYTYSSPGTYEIIQILGIEVTPKSDTLVIEVYEPTETQFKVEKCNLNGIIVTSEEQVYDFIRVYFTSTDSVSLNFDESASFNYPSTSTQTFQTKGFYTDAKENCTSFSHIVDPLPTLEVPNILSSSIKETCSDHFVLVMEIDSYDSLISYQVELDQSGTTNIYEGGFDDNIVIVSSIPYSKNEDEYCVNINAVDICTGAVVSGTPFCVSTSSLSTSPFENLYATYTETGVFLNMDSVYAGELLVFRKLGEDGEYELRSTVQNDYLDPLSTLSRQYFYRIDYLDSCGSTLFSAETNPPLISSNTLEENKYQISYTVPSGTFSSITSTEYEIGNDITTTEMISDESFEIGLDPANGTRQFLQAVVTLGDGIILRSNKLTFKYKPIIHVPSAFTPNGDGLNDTLELFGLPTQTATTRIYSRWGKLIYDSTEPIPGWDGLINGQLAEEGAYLYEIIFEDSDGVIVNQKGTFALIKK